VRRLAEDRQLVPGPDGWQLRPSADLDAVLAGVVAGGAVGIEALSAPERQVLRILGEAGALSFDDALGAVEAAGVPTAQRVLEQLLRAGWLDVDGDRVRVVPGAGPSGPGYSSGPSTR
ncbi:MAG: hypothetical protein ABMB14_33170, partial [Myxococcota bacterium]